MMPPLIFPEPCPHLTLSTMSDGQSLSNVPPQRPQPLPSALVDGSTPLIYPPFCLPFVYIAVFATIRQHHIPA